MMEYTEEEINQLAGRKFKSEIFKKIITGSKLLRENLNLASDIFISDKNTTIVKPSKDEKYIRINKKDLFRTDFSEYFEWLLAMDPEKNIDQVQQDILLKDGFNLDITDEIAEFYKDMKEKHEELSSKELKEKTEEMKKEASGGSCEMSGGHGFSKSSSVSAKEISRELSETPSIDKKVESKKAIEKEVKSDEIIEPDIEAAMKHAEEFDSYEDRDDLSAPYLDEPVLSLDDIKYLNKLKNKMLKAFKGNKGKSSSYSPSKRINIKKDIIDKDNIYIKTTMSEGKHVDMNIIIDMSGSMNGSPIIYANSILYLFNELSIEGHFNGDVIFTSDKKPYKVTLPISREKVFNLCGAHGSSEGFKDTVLQYKNELKNSNVIAITDGHITDKP